MVRAWISEQPVSELRYRYKSERRRRSEHGDPETGRQAAGIPGVNSTPEKKTHPTIIIEGYQGWATVRVSCVFDVEENGRYRPHPHELVGTDCKGGFFEEWFEVKNPLHVKQFDKMSIRCVRKRDIRPALERRMRHKVDPFGTGIDHAEDPHSINLGAVRLCFEVFVHKGDDGLRLFRFVSDVIRDVKKMSKLNITYCSHTSAPVTGTDNNIVLLCDRILSKEINVVFFEESEPNGTRPWEVSVTSDFIFQHVAVAVKVPPYKNPQSTLNHKVFMELWDSSDDSRSKSYPFVFTPIYTGHTFEPKAELSPTSYGINFNPLLRQQEETSHVSYETKYGKFTIPKRQKRLYPIPPALYERPTAYKFQTQTLEKTATQQSSTSTGSKYTDVLQQKSSTTVDRLYSLPGPSNETPFFLRGSSYPGSDAFSQNSVTASSTFVDFNDPSTSTRNIMDPISPQEFSVPDNSQAMYFGNESNVGDFQEIITNFANPQLALREDSMDTSDSSSMFKIEHSPFDGEGSSSQSVLPPTNSSNQNSLPSMDEILSQISSARNRSENEMTQEQFLEMVNSPNYPVFEDLL